MQPRSDFLSFATVSNPPFLMRNGESFLYCDTAHIDLPGQRGRILLAPEAEGLRVLGIQMAQADARVDLVHAPQGALLDQPQLLAPDVQRVAVMGDEPGLAVGGGGREPQDF